MQMSVDAIFFRILAILFTNLSNTYVLSKYHIAVYDRSCFGWSLCYPIVSIGHISTEVLYSFRGFVAKDCFVKNDLWICWCGFLQAESDWLVICLEFDTSGSLPAIVLLTNPTINFKTPTKHEWSMYPNILIWGISIPVPGWKLQIFIPGPSKGFQMDVFIGATKQPLRIQTPPLGGCW